MCLRNDHFCCSVHHSTKNGWSKRLHRERSNQESFFVSSTIFEEKNGIVALLLDFNDFWSNKRVSQMIRNLLILFEQDSVADFLGFFSSNQNFYNLQSERKDCRGSLACDKFSILYHNLIYERELSIEIILEWRIASDFLPNSDFVSLQDKCWRGADRCDELATFFLMFQQITDQTWSCHCFSTTQSTGEDLKTSNDLKPAFLLF